MSGKTLRILIVVDMQNDFVDGALGTPEAVAILPAVTEKIRAYRAKGGLVFATLDTHGENYLSTQEGSFLPVPHCIRGTAGWELAPAVRDTLPEDVRIVEKPAFGSPELVRLVGETVGGGSAEVELVGLCTDICVVSNALLLKAAYPELPVSVDPACCAGVTPASHDAALTTMKMCQVRILS